jgi:predicted N-formylglutamate amidohydrolase
MNDAAFERIRPANGPAGLIFLCDHAANALPEGYGTLGLAPELLTTHIAYDIGAAAVVRFLAARFAAPAILGRWSRLLIDLNRGEDDPTLVMKLSDGSIISGNRDAGPEEIARRISLFHAPYHAAVAAEIAAVAGQGRVPVLVSIHSFTPVWKGCRRIWEAGVLWHRDGRLARPLIARLAAAGFTVGDNEPYAGALEGDTLDRHGLANGLPHVLIEIRQDLIAAAPQAEAFAGRLVPILSAALADMGPPERLVGQKTHN